METQKDFSSIDFKTQAEEIHKEQMAKHDLEDWKVLDANGETKVSMRDDGKGFFEIKKEIVTNKSPEDYFKHAQVFLNWRLVNDRAENFQKLADVDEQTQVWYFTLTPPIPFVSTRDFLCCHHFRQCDDGHYAVTRFPFEDEQVPGGKKMVRATQMFDYTI